MANDVEELRNNITPNMILCGYNNKNYDRYILKAILAGENPKEMNDWIIKHEKGGWEYVYEKPNFIVIPPQIDLMQDTLGLSLKEIEGNIGMNIKETSVDFSLDRPLTEKELLETIEYCKADVSVLPKLWQLRADYINAKITLCEMANIPLEEGLELTNAKLTAKFLNAKKQNLPTRREFDYNTIPNIDWQYIPLEITEFFDQVIDKSISDDDLEGSKLDIMIGNVPSVIAFGGIHGAVNNIRIASDDNNVILNYDVSSLYPSIVLNYNYVSRAIPSKDLYEEVYHNRLKAKKEGNKAIANAYKLILNTFYGAMNNQYNELYDPSYNLATCITGQILLVELIYKLIEKITSFDGVQFNTDGIMFVINRNEKQAVLDIIHSWEKQHNLIMEEDVIKQVIQRDVNNYVIELEDGHLKYKGGTLSDYNKKDSWKHNSLAICAEAIVKKLVYDTDIAETILNCNDLSKFQMITKTGHTYTGTVRLIDGEYTDIQRVNRVFAGNNPSLGAIYKTKSDGKGGTRYDKVANCPLSTVVDGYDTFTIDDINKQWYIDYAIKKHNEFIINKEEIKNANKKRKSINNGEQLSFST